MLRSRCAVAITAVVMSLVVVASATATPATPVISVQQPSELRMRLTSSTGTHWSWTIVDSAGAPVASSTANPAVLNFAAPGDYTALLDATDDDPLAPAPAHATTTFHVYARPVPDFSYTPLADGTIQFTDTSAGDPTGWTWSFPGGSTFKGKTPPPQVLPVGTSSVTLKVTNPAGNHNVTKPVVVNGPPVPVLSVLSSPAAIGAPVLLDASRSTDPNQDALTYSWDLDGDGRFGDGAGALQTVSYGAAGRYRVAVQVSDGHGATATAEASISVLVDQPPVVAFTNDPAQPGVGAGIWFTASASDPDGSISAIEWDLDDDGQFDDAAGARASWAFPTPGSHRVAVRAVDDRGVATVAFRAIVVTAPAPTSPTDPTAAASAGPSPIGSASGPALIPNGPTPSTRHRALPLSPFPVVRISGLILGGAVRITLLKVQAPRGATIRVRCRGGSCSPAKADVRVKAASSAVRVRSLERRSLRAGTVVEVFVTAPKRIGKYTRFTVRRGGPPARTDRCLPPGRTRPIACPTV
jgi:PKD repeat protein